jgi:hypothetical protein
LLFNLYENFNPELFDEGHIMLFGFEIPDTYWNIIKFLGVVFFTTVSWLIVTFITQPVKEQTLRSFYSKIRPGGPGWQSVIKKAKAEGIELVKEKDLKWDVPTGILCMMFGSMAIYSLLFSIGYSLYGQYNNALLFAAISLISVFFLIRFWRKLTIL